MYIYSLHYELCCVLAGKSSLLSQFVDRNFTEEYDPTVQYSKLKENHSVKKVFHSRRLDTAIGLQTDTTALPSVATKYRNSSRFRRLT